MADDNPAQETTQTQDNRVVVKGGKITKEELQQMVTAILEKAGEKPGKYVNGAYNVRPGNKFIDEQDDEEVVLMLRSHPITNVGWIVGLTLVVLVLEIFLGIGILGS